MIMKYFPVPNSFLRMLHLLWYRTKREKWRTFDDFTGAFRERLGAPDFQYAVVEKIHRRTQGYNEPVSDYLTCIRGLMHRAIPVFPTAQQIEIALRNMLPRLDLGLYR